jgi:hypothetical protein
MMSVNYLPAVSLSGHEYCPLVLNPGLTQFGHQYRDAAPLNNLVLSDIKNRIDLRVRLEAGKTYFIAYRYWINPFHRRPNPTMVWVVRDTGIPEISTCSIKKSLSASHEN